MKLAVCEMEFYGRNLEINIMLPVQPSKISKGVPWKSSRLNKVAGL